MGFLLLLNVAIVKLKSINLLAPLVGDTVGALLAANICFIVAFILSVFGGGEDKE